MDAHSISYTTPSRRASSRIYQDLAACRLASSCHANPTIDHLIMNSTSKIRVRSPSKPPKVCVIGAGVSGLRCADVLLQHGFDVTIWEARDRIGGRMHQTKLSSGQKVDLGPNWIHGTDHNPILDLAKETETATHLWGEKVNIFDEYGDLLPDGHEMGDAMWGIIIQAFKHSGKNTSEIDSKQSLYDFFVEKLDEIVPAGEEVERKRKIVLQLAEFWGAFVGSPVTKQSLKFFWLEECIDGENLFCAGTYEKILATIAKPALSCANVQFLTKVVQIKTVDDTAQILAENGRHEKFDEVVVTLPLGWLKINKIAFYPQLPERLCRAIDAIGYGSLEKVYITFPRAFWLHGDPSKEEFTGFTQYLAPSYSRDTNPQRWNQESVDMSTLPGSSAHPTLLYYLYGDQSVKLATDLERLSSNEAKEEHLVNFFKPYFSLLPNYEEGSKDCTPVSSLATTWVLDEYAGYGSYSTFRTGLGEGDKDIEVMRAGLPGRSLWFAGEHVAPFVALGTVTGAYWSGEAVARRIAAAYQMTAGHQTPDCVEVEDIVSHDGAKEVNVRGFADKGLEK